MCSMRQLIAHSTRHASRYFHLHGVWIGCAGVCASVCVCRLRRFQHAFRQLFPCLSPSFSPLGLPINCNILLMTDKPAKATRRGRGGSSSKWKVFKHLLLREFSLNCFSGMWKMILRPGNYVRLSIMLASPKIVELNGAYTISGASTEGRKCSGEVTISIACQFNVWQLVCT